MVLPEEYHEMLSGLPEAVRDSLPEEVAAFDAETASAAWQSLSSPRALLTYVFQRIRAGWQGYLRLFLQLCGVLLLRGVMNGVSSYIKGAALSSGVQLICRVALFGIIIDQAMSLLTGVVAFFEDLTHLTSGYIPLMGTMYAMGGNVGAAAVNHGHMILSMSLIQWLGGVTIVPLFSLCLAFTLPGAFGPSVAGRMAVITGKLKKWYTTALSLTMLLLSASLGAQTTLAARADSLRFRTVRFAVSSSIPIVGGGVAEALRTAAGGVSWLRGVVGVGGVILLLWLLLPQLIHLLLTRTVYGLAGDVAAWLGCEGEGRLLGEIAGLFGYLLAVVALSVTTFLLSLLLLLKCGAAFGG